MHVSRTANANSYGLLDTAQDHLSQTTATYNHALNSEEEHELDLDPEAADDEEDTPTVGTMVTQLSHPSSHHPHSVFEVCTTLADIILSLLSSSPVYVLAVSLRVKMRMRSLPPHNVDAFRVKPQPIPQRLHNIWFPMCRGVRLGRRTMIRRHRRSSILLIHVSSPS